MRTAFICTATWALGCGAAAGDARDERPTADVRAPAGGDPTTGEAGVAYVPEAIVVSVERQPDGDRYPNWVSERFELETDGYLDYSAYFGGMPIEMNHNDSVHWDAGESGAAVFGALRGILADPTLLAELAELADDAPDPPADGGTFKLRLERNHGDVTFILDGRSPRAFAILEAAWRAMVSAFETATGRPLKPGDLPQ